MNPTRLNVFVGGNSSEGQRYIINDISKGKKEGRKKLNEQSRYFKAEQKIFRYLLAGLRLVRER